MNPLSEHNSVRRWVVYALAALTLFLLSAGYALLRNGLLAGLSIQPQATITVSGTGDAIAVPDVARITFSVRARANEVPQAEAEVTEKSNAIIRALRNAGVAERDIKTVGYSVRPQYEWIDRPIICITTPCPPEREREFAGYDVVQRTEVTVREVSTTGQIVQIVSDGKPDTVDGPNFEIDDIERVRGEARAEAIEMAEGEAERLADALGVSLVRVLSFSEGGRPFFGRAAAEASFDDEALEFEVPEILPGEAEIAVTVTITYEIR